MNGEPFHNGRYRSARRVGALVLLGAISFPGGAAATLTQTHEYRIEISEDFSRLEVAACFEGAAPQRLRTGSGRAGQYLKEATIRVDGESRSLSATRGVLRIGERPDDDCMRYAVDLGKAARNGNPRIAARAGESLVLSPRVWLWRPRGAGEYTRYELDFRLPAEWDISTPWQEMDHDEQAGRYRFRMANDPLVQELSMLVGRFHRINPEWGGFRLEAVLAEGPGPAADPELIEQWLERGVAAAATVLGGFPTRRAQAVILTTADGGRPLVSGRTTRGGDSGMLLQVDPKLADRAFLDEALLAHELIHLLHPPVTRQDAWLPEGIATYYQYLSLARSGELREKQFWERLLAGFERGYWDRRQDTLGRITRNMHRQGGVEYVYWSGAAMMLLADVRLRSREDQPTSLDRVLAEWADCCLDRDHSQEGREALRELDGIARGKPVFYPMYEEHVLAVGLPEVDDALRFLGVEETEDGVVLNDEAPGAGIRRAMLERPDSPAP